MNYANRTEKKLNAELKEPRQVVTATDRATRKRENISDVSQELLYQFVDSSPDAFLLLDSKMHCINLNKTAQNLFNLKPEEVIGKNMSEFVPGMAEASNYDKYMEVIKTGRPFFNDDVFYSKMPTDKHLATRAFKIGDGLGIVFIDITDLKCTEAALKKSEEKYRTILEEMQENYCEIDLEGKITFANDTLCKSLGFSSQEVVGMDLGVLATKEHLDEAWKVWSQVSCDGVSVRNFIHRIVRKDGTVLLLLCTLFPIRDAEGKITGVRGLGLDITEHSDLLARLRQAETAITSCISAICNIDMDGKLTYVNQAFLSVWGYGKPQEILGKSFYSLYEEEQDIQNAMESVCTDKVAKAMELVASKKDGTEFIVGLRASPIVDSENEITGITVSLADITERKCLEQELRVKDHALASSINGIAIIDLKGKLVYVNQAFLSLWGYDGEIEVLGKRATRFWEIGYKASQLLRRLREGHNWVGEMTAVRRDGSLFDAQVSASLVKDETGNTVGYMGSFVDITERNKMAKSLSESEEKYRSVVERANDGICIIQDGMVKYVNPMLANMWGGTVEEAIGTSFMNYVYPDDLPTVEDNYKRRMVGELVPSVYDTAMRRKDGSKVDVELNVGVVEYRGEPAEIIILRDISERKKMEEELKLRAKLLDSASDAIVLHDFEGNIFYANERAAMFLGYNREEFMKMNVSQTTVHYKIKGEILEELKKKGAVVFEDTVLHKNGGKFVVEINARLVGLGDKKFILSVARDMTERRKMEETLRQNEARLLEAQRNAHIGNWEWNVVTGDLYWSDENYHIFGIDPRRVKPSVEGFLDIVEPTELEFVKKSIEDALNNIRPYDIDFGISRPDGTRRIVNAKAKVVFDDTGKAIRMVGTVHDITERKKMEEELKLRAQLLDRANDAIMLHDFEGNIFYANEEAYRSVGFSIEEFMSIGVQQVSARGQKLMEWLQQKIIEEGVVVFEDTVLHKDGDSHPIEVNAMLIELDDKNLVLSVSRDISERKKVDRLKDEFFGLVSHELRSPLTTIIGTLSTLVTEGSRITKKEAHQLLSDTASEAESLAHLLDDLLELSRAQAGQLHIYSQPTMIKQIVKEVMKKLEKQYRTHKFGEEIPDKITEVYTDPLVFKHIIYNLLDNAAKYSQQGTEIRVSARLKKDTVVIGVTDQGIGIPARYQDRLFQPFERLSDIRCQFFKGVGLGLAVCKRLIEAQGGRIWVKSGVGKGSTFFFTLPLTKVKPKEN